VKLTNTILAFGQAIRAARKAKGISRNQLADRARLLESLPDDISDKGLRIVTATAKEIKDVETEDG